MPGMLDATSKLAFRRSIGLCELLGQSVRRGELYRVYRGAAHDPKTSRVFVGRQILIESRYSTVICAPVLTNRDGLATQVSVGAAEGLKRGSSIHCDELMSLLRVALTEYVGFLGRAKPIELNEALATADVNRDGRLPASGVYSNTRTEDPRPGIDALAVSLYKASAK